MEGWRLLAHSISSGAIRENGSSFLTFPVSDKLSLVLNSDLGSVACLVVLSCGLQEWHALQPEMNLICKDLSLLSTSKCNDTFLFQVTAAVFDGFYQKILHFSLWFLLALNQVIVVLLSYSVKIFFG